MENLTFWDTKESASQRKKHCDVNNTHKPVFLINPLPPSNHILMQAAGINTAQLQALSKTHWAPHDTPYLKYGNSDRSMKHS